MDHDMGNISFDLIVTNEANKEKVQSFLSTQSIFSAKKLKTVLTTLPLSESLSDDTLSIIDLFRN